jgi:hypothetical protein
MIGETMSEPKKRGRPKVKEPIE